MTRQLDRKIGEDSTVADAVSLMELPEFKNAQTKIVVCHGKPENKAGKVIISHGAGTNGGYEVAKAYFQHGTDTLIYIHISPSDLEVEGGGKGQPDSYRTHRQRLFGHKSLVRELKKRGLRYQDRSG